MRCSCIICADLFVAADALVAIPCGHVFHARCLEEWFTKSSTCPGCRMLIKKQNVVKLYFDTAPTEGTDLATLENELDDLKAQLTGKNMELAASEKKVDELRSHAASAEQTMSELHQKCIKLEFDYSTSKIQIENFRQLEKKNKTLKLENEYLARELECLGNVKTIVTGCQKDVDSILHEMQIKVAKQSGESAASKMAIYCSVLKRELQRSISEKDHLRKELSDARKSIGVKTNSLLNLKKQLLNATTECKGREFAAEEEKRKSLHHLLDSVPSTPEPRIIKGNKSSPDSAKGSSVDASTPIVMDFNMKKTMSVVVLNKEVGKLNEASHTSTPRKPLLRPGVFKKKRANDDSVSRIGYNGLGVHECFVVKRGCYERPILKGEKKVLKSSSRTDVKNQAHKNDKGVKFTRNNLLK